MTAPRTGTSSATARPTLASYPPLIASVRWVTRDGQRSLVVTPHPVLRTHQEEDWARAAWRQVVAAMPGADTPGMANQFVCHMQFAPRKDAWYLEPDRPAVGYPATVLAGCNPGDQRDGG